MTSAEPGSASSVPDIAIGDCWRQIGVRGDRSCPELEQHLHCRNCPTYKEIARNLLNRPLPPGYRDEWARHFAQARTDEAVENAEGSAFQTVVVFRLGEEWLALPVGCFQEVAELRSIHSLPHRRNSAVLGIVNVRGELLVCVSLAKLLGVDDRKTWVQDTRTKAFPRLIVVGNSDKRVAFAVDEMHGIYRFKQSDQLAVPATVGKASSTMTAAMVSWRRGAVGCLDEALLLAMLDRAIA
ncbi:chemotaxis protein CheW [Mesorhizobium sp. M0578]|uniref:chemotaxis protein CheW n=1 Tax=unclassified Mesorhizobium TaxID=325217 RepID=UPI003335AACB